MYNIYLDGVLIKDTPIGLDRLEHSILRDDGLSDGDQIIRYRVTSSLTFWGDGYVYLCQKKKDNICELVDVLITDICNNKEVSVFGGTIPITWIEFNHTHKTAQSQIRDNAFSAYVKDFIKTEVNLWSVKTKNCLPINPIGFDIEFETIHNAVGNPKNVLSFDVIDALQFILDFVTDNKIKVVSNFYSTPIGAFDSNLYAFTTGYNLRTTTTQGDIEAIYPSLSFEKIIIELRKKHRIFMDCVGDTLYIEREDDMYSNDVVMEIDGIPNGLIETTDKTRLFNGFKVGSTDTKLENNAHSYYSADKLSMWGEYNISSCGGCTTTVDNINSNLDLVSEFIIDSNMIYEQINTSSDSKDKDIYLVNYYKHGFDNQLKSATTDYINGEWVYNTKITNQKVIDNWIGGTPQCIADRRYSDLGFYLKKESYSASINIIPSPFIPYIFDIIQFNIVNDIGNNVFIPTTPQSVNVVTSAFTGTSTQDITYFKCPINTSLSIRTDWVNLKQSAGANWVGFGFDYSLYLVHYTDDTFTTIINTYSTSVHVNDAKNEPKDLSVLTGMIPVNAGECFLAIVNIEALGGLYAGLNFDFACDFINMRLIDADNICKTTTNDLFKAKINQFEFDYEVCYEDFNNLVSNKKGAVLVNGIKAWIKEVKYTKQKTTFRLVSGKTLCGT